MKKSKAVLLPLFFLTVVVVVTSCDRSGLHKPFGLQRQGLPKKDERPVTYSEVKPIFKQHCGRCHPAFSPPDWQNYEQAQSRTVNGVISILYQRLDAGRNGASIGMPQAGSPEASAITDFERQRLMAWAAAEGPGDQIDPVQPPVVPTPEPPPVTPEPPPANPEDPVAPAPPPPVDREQELIAQCTSCHGVLGVSTNPMFPMLAAQNVEYVKNQLRVFRSDERKSPMMGPIAKNLSDEDFMIIANYFAAAPPTRKKVYIPDDQQNQTPLAVAKGCTGCHLGPDGKSTNGLYPNLLGQHRDYLDLQLKNYRSGVRTNPLMNRMASTLSDEEIRSIADYFSGRE